MKIYYNGCSLTYGDELKNPTKSAWPTLVSKHYKLDFLNDAVSGGTNDRIVYRTIKHINEYDFFVIAWTNYARFTEYNPVNNYEINFNPNITIDTHKHIDTDLVDNPHKITDYAKMYYKYWYNELYELKLWLQQIILLQALLQKKRKKFIMLNAFDNNLNKWLQPREKFTNAIALLVCVDAMNDDQLIREHIEIQKLVNLIDCNTFIGWNENWYIRELSKEYPIGPKGHILEEGHNAVAKRVIKHAKRVIKHAKN